MRRNYLPRLLSQASLLAIGLTVACGAPDDQTPWMDEADVLPEAAGRWSPVVTLPLVPAAAAVLPNGKVLLWASLHQFTFGGSGGTSQVIFDPANGRVVERFASESKHDMFCPGTAYLSDGRLLVNGGADSAATSLYDPGSDRWEIGAAMNIPRGYNASTTLPDGSVLTLGGSWSGGRGGKNAEVWTAANGWRVLSGVPVGPFVGTDAGGVPGDYHMWLMPTDSGRVLHVGPTAAMHWIDTAGNGAIIPAGTRGDDSYAVNAVAVMYDAGKILKTGGAPGYSQTNATTATYLISASGNSVSVAKLAPMIFARAFANGVVLPTGDVMIIGGQTLAVPFSDDHAVMIPELWDHNRHTFSRLPEISVPRPYHSIALLLPDATVLSAGGGLCSTACTVNHPNLQIYTPGYLLNSDKSLAKRPVIVSAPTQASHGATISVTTNSAINSFVLMRLGATTHTVNNDQRRIPLAFAQAGHNTYHVDVPRNAGLAVPGLYMMFAIANGVPSVAKIVRISG